MCYIPSSPWSEPLFSTFFGLPLGFPDGPLGGLLLLFCPVPTGPLGTWALFSLLSLACLMYLFFVPTYKQDRDQCKWRSEKGVEVSKWIRSRSKFRTNAGYEQVITCQRLGRFPLPLTRLNHLSSSRIMVLFVCVTKDWATIWIEWWQIRKSSKAKFTGFCC